MTEWELDEACKFLQEWATQEVKLRGIQGTKQHEFARGVRYGAFQAILKMGFEDAALDATSQAEDSVRKRPQRISLRKAVRRYKPLRRGIG